MNRIPGRASALMALLDALEQDILSAPAQEIRDVQRDTGRGWEPACQEIRSLLTEALAALAEGAAAAPLADSHQRPGLNLH